MSSHAHVILEVPAPKEVSSFWDLNLSASFSSQGVSRFTRSRDRQSATNTPSYRCCPGSLLSSSPSCATLPVHHSSPALKPVTLKVQLPMFQSTVWCFMTARAPHRGSLIAIVPRRSAFPMQHALSVEFDQPPLRPPSRSKANERAIETETKIF